MSKSEVEDFCHELAAVARDQIDQFIEEARVELKLGRASEKVGGSYRLRLIDDRVDRWVELRFDFLDNYERVASDLRKSWKSAYQQ